jgi:hypothetical protein
MTKTYTFSECYDILRVDPKTFRRWLEKAGINPDEQVSRVDNRIRYLTQEQVERLAKDHGRSLQAVEQRPAEMIPANAYKLLLQRVEDLERQSARSLNYQEDYEQRLNKALDEHSTGIEQQGAQLKAHDEAFLKQAEYTSTIDARLIALEQQFEQTSKELDQAKRSIIEVAGSLQERNADLENKLTDAQARISELELTKTKRSSASKSSQEPAQIIGLPKGSVTARNFAETHQVDRFHMQKWIDEERFETTLTKRGERNQHNLTPEQQAAVIVWWNEQNIAYTPCERCPHEPLIKQLA